MRIHALALVKNEADVIGQSLTAAAAWADAIYVYDNGSDDGTWEIVHELAAAHPNIFPAIQDPTPYRQSHRRALFQRYRGERGDWWGFLDADEIYIDDPRAFLAAVSRKYGEVWNASFEYYFTDVDAARYESDPDAYADEVPIAEKCRYFVNNWSELRFFRDTERVYWPEGDGSPEGLDPVYPGRIRLKHFQYRSPQQIQRRIDSRREALERGSFLHEMIPDWKHAILRPLEIDFSAASPAYAPTTWRDRVVDASELTEDRGEYVVDEAALPSIPRAWPRWVRTLRAGARRMKHFVTRRSE
jgi:glycosyltransferase involved in cell wall biosynthesis